MQSQMLWANHAGTSWPKPDAVKEAVTRVLAEPPHVNAGLVEDAAVALCSLVGLQHEDRLLFTPGCTAALALVMADLPWRSGDVVLTSSLEHHALVRCVEQLANRGVVHLQAPYAPGAVVDLDWIRARLQTGNVRVLAMTGASNVTGECLPLAALCNLAHEYGALFLLDAAQVAGTVPLDLAAIGVDIAVFAGHKGLLGPQGVGALWAAPHVAFESPAAVCAVGDHAPPCAPYPGWCDAGSANLAGIAGLAAGINWRGQHPNAAQQTLELAAGLRQQLAPMEGVRVLGGEGPYTSAVSVEVAAHVLRDAERQFGEHNIVVRAGQHCAPQALVALGVPDGTLRISLGPEQDKAAVSRICSALRGLVTSQVR